VEFPFDITFQGFTFKILEDNDDNTLEVALMSKPYGFKGEVSDGLIYKLYYYLRAEGFIDSDAEID
jgi:hypothetical protein